MKKILSDKLPRILRSKKQIEKTFGITITNRGKEVYIKGTPENEFLGKKAIDAINFGFAIYKVLDMKKEEFDFQTLNIKEHSVGKDMRRIKGRVIGKHGKNLQTFSNMTHCYVELKDNYLGLIGSPEDIKTAFESIQMLVKGAQHGNVYKNIERNRPLPLSDLGLKHKE